MDSPVDPKQTPDEARGTGDEHPSAPTGALPISQWGGACARGFVRDSRFGDGQVIKGTNRNTSRKWRNSKESGPGARP